MAIGEAGSITTNSPTENQPITITLTEALTNPVFALSATNNGGDEFVLRVVGQTLDGDGNTTAFTFIIEEWEFLDGPHPAIETVAVACALTNWQTPRGSGPSVSLPSLSAMACLSVIFWCRGNIGCLSVPAWRRGCSIPRKC